MGPLFSLFAAFILTSTPPEDGAESSQLRYSSVEIHIPKNPDRDEDYLSQVLVGIVRENLLQIQDFYREKINDLNQAFKFERTIQTPLIELLLISPFQKEMAEQEESIRKAEKNAKARRGKLQALRTTYLQKGRERILVPLKNKAKAKRLLSDLEALQLTITMTLNIYPGLERVEASFLRPDQEASDELLGVKAHLKARPILELESLDLSLENVIIGDRVEVSLEPLLREGLIAIETSEFQIGATLRVYDNLAVKRDDAEAAALLFPVTALQTNFASVSVKPDNVEDIARRALNPEQIQALLNGIQDLESFRQLQAFVGEEVMAQAQDFNLQLGVLVTTDAKNSVVVEPVSEDMLKRVELHRLQGDLVLYGQMSLPLTVRKFESKLDLRQRRLSANLKVPHQTELTMEVRELYLRSEALKLNSNLAEGGLRLNTELKFQDVENSTQLQLKWDGNRLVWDPGSTKMSLPFLNGIQILCLQLNDFQLDFLSDIPIDVQIQKEAPKLAHLLATRVSESDRKALSQMVMDLLLKKLQEIQNQPIPMGSKATLSVAEIEWPHRSLDLNLQADAQTKKVAADAKMELPTRVHLVLNDLDSPEASLAALDVILSFNPTIADQLKVKAEVVSSGDFPMSLLEDNFDLLVQSLTLDSVSAAGVSPKASLSVAGAKAVVANGIEGTADLLLPEKISGWFTASRFITGFGLKLWINKTKNEGAASAVRAKIEEAKKELASLIRTKLNESMDATLRPWLKEKLSAGGAFLVSQSVLNFQETSEAKALLKLDELMMAEELNANVVGFPSNARLLQLQSQSDAMIRSWISGAISTNAAVIERAFIDFYEESGESALANKVDDALVSLEHPEDPKTAKVALASKGPSGNLSESQRNEHLGPNRMTAVVHLSLLNDTISKNLQTIQTLLLEKARANQFVNETFELELYEPVSTSGKFITVNETGDLEMRIGFRAKQDTVLLQRVTSWIGLIPDGILSFLSGEKIDVFQKIFSVPGLIVDVPLGWLADLDTHEVAELRAVAAVELSSLADDSYSLSIEIKKLQILYVDPVTLLTKVALEIAIPSAFEGFKQQMQFQPPQIPVLGSQAKFRIPAGETAIVADEGRQAIIINILADFPPAPAELPTLVYEPFESSKKKNEETLEAPVPSADLKWKLPELTNISLVPYQNSDGYSIYLSTKDDDELLLRSMLESRALAPADYVRRFYQSAVRMKFGLEKERGSGFTNPKEGIVDLTIQLSSQTDPKALKEWADQLSDDVQRQQNLFEVLQSTAKKNLSPILRQFLPDFPQRETGKNFPGTALEAALRWHDLRDPETLSDRTRELNFKDTIHLGDLLLVENAEGQVVVAGILISSDFMWQRSEKGRLEFVSLSEALRPWPKGNSWKLRVLHFK